MISYLVPYLHITCPHCSGKQRFKQATDGIYFPIRPFCCEIMYLADDKPWNDKLDRLINQELDSATVKN